jgi:acetyl esterase
MQDPHAELGTPPFVREDVAAFLAAGEASGAPPLNRLPVDQARAAMRAMGQMADADPAPLPVVRDLVCPGPGGPVPLRLYDRRVERPAGPLVLFFHGGGFVFGDLESHDSFCRFLASELDLPILAVDYRLAPEHPFPAFADDAEAAARWSAASPEALGRDVTGLVTCGDSAGGHIAILLAQQLAKRPAEVPVLAQLAFYPFLGAGHDWPSSRRFAEGFMLTAEAIDWIDRLVGEPGSDPRYNLLNGEPPANVPLVIQTASLDPLRDQGVAYAEKAHTAGARVMHFQADGMIHGYVTIRRALPSSNADIACVLDAARGLLSQDSSSLR